MSLKTNLLRGALGAVLGAAMFLAVGMPASAARDYTTDCHNRLEADRARIDRDNARFGPNSRAVAHDVQRMDSDRTWCRDHHADWDHSRFDVGIYLGHH